MAVAARGEGEVVRDSAKSTVEIKAALEHFSLLEFRYSAGVSGPERHIHREHADCFWVLEGELEFELGPDATRIPAGPGSWVMAPPGLVHTFRNASGADARFLNLHAPDKGFADYMRGAAESFDTFDPPDDGGLPLSAGILRRPGEGRRLAVLPMEVKAGVDDAGGHVSLTESELPGGFPGPVRHVHRRTVDSFYVLAGTLTLDLDGRELEASQGTYAVVEPGTPHTFANRGEEPVRILNLMAPGGFERYFLELDERVEPGTPPDPALMAEIAAKYDFEPAG